MEKELFAKFRDARCMRNLNFIVGITVSTSTSPTIGNLAYWTSKDGWPETLGSVATTTLTATSPLSLSIVDVALLAIGFLIVYFIQARIGFYFK